MPNTDLPIVIKNGPRNIKNVSVTFDDGPDTEFTPKVLGILKEFQVPATFFVQGEFVKRYPAMLNKILDGGHELGNHSWDHPKMTGFPLDKMFNQLGQTNFLVSELTQRRMRLYRPPYGAVNEEELHASYSIGYYVINWDVDTADWDKSVTGDQIVEKVKKTVQPGSIILMHSVPWILEDRLVALRQILDYIKNELSYTFVKVSTLLDIPAYLNDNAQCAQGITQKVHTVKKGETLAAIAKKYGVTVDSIVKKNKISNPNAIQEGQKLIIP